MSRSPENLLMLLVMSPFFALIGCLSVIGKEIGRRGFLWPLFRGRMGFWVWQQAGGRGRLLARLVDALNRVSLLFRGSVPGGSAARSFLLQRDHLAPDEPTQFGRVVRDVGWIVCQYWFFYAFNNWAFGIRRGQ
jgi:hypothetical protein